MGPTRKILSTRFIDPILIVLSLILCGYIWMWKMDEYYFIHDSAFHLSMGHHIFSHFFSHVSVDTHPPLYYVFLKLSQWVFGVNNPLMLRCASWIAGFVAVYAGFLLALSCTRRKSIGLFVSFLLATSPQFILQTQAIRNYSLLVSLIFCVLVLIQKRFSTFRQFTYLFVLLTLLTATHYSSIVFLPSFLLIGLFRVKYFKVPPKTQIFLGVFFSLFITLNGGLTVWMAAQRPPSGQSEINIIHLKKAGVNSLSEVGPMFFEFLKICFGQHPSWLILGLTLLGISKLISEKHWENILLLIGPLLMAIILSIGGYYPLNSNRHTLYLLPLVLLAVTFGLKWIAELSHFLLVFLFIGILASQIIEKPTIYDTIQWRNSPRHYSEIGPTLSEIKSLKSMVSQPEFESESTLFLNWDLATSLEMEKNLKPDWAILSKLKTPIQNCFLFSQSDKSSVCRCLESKKHHKVALFVIPKTQEAILNLFNTPLDCAHLIGAKPISEHYIMVSLSIH